METSINQPPQPEKIETLREVEIDTALSNAVDGAQMRLSEGGNSSTFSLDGREYSISNPADFVINRAQMRVKAVEGILFEIGRNNSGKEIFRQETALAKILNITEKQEELARAYAEFLALYPEATKKLESFIPGLTAISEEGKDFKYSSQQVH